MNERFIRWAIVLAIFLTLCSIGGLTLRSAVDPHRPEYSSRYGYIASNTPQPRWQPPEETVSQSREQLFDAPQGPTRQEQESLALFLKNLQNLHAEHLNNDNPSILKEFSADRMTQEWIRFGYFQLAQLGVSYRGHLDTVKENMPGHLDEKLREDVAAFAVSDITILDFKRSRDGADIVVRTRHHLKTGDRSRTWHARWWLTQVGPYLRIYDYECQPSGLRAGAVMASRIIARLPHELSKGRDAVTYTDEVVTLVGRMMTRGEIVDKPQTGPEPELIPPLDGYRKVIFWRSGYTLPLKSRIEAQLKRWSDSPVLHLMLAADQLDFEYVQNYLGLAGDHPWAIAICAEIDVRAYRKQQAIEVLQAGLKENTGHPILLKTLYPLLPHGERAVLGMEAAKGVNPSLALELMTVTKEKTDSPMTMREMVKKYLEILPKDPEALATLAALEAGLGRPDDAAKLLRETFADAKVERQKQLTKRFAAVFVRQFDKPVVSLPASIQQLFVE